MYVRRHLIVDTSLSTHGMRVYVAAGKHDLKDPRMSHISHSQVL